MWYTWVPQMFLFPTGPALLWKGTEDTIFLFFYYFFSFSLYNNNRMCLSGKNGLPHRCVKTVMPQLLCLSCVTHPGLLALGSGVFARYLEKSAGRRVFCLSFLFCLLSRPILLFICIVLAPKFTVKQQPEPAGSSQRSSGAHESFSHLRALVPSLLWEQRAGPRCSTHSNSSLCQQLRRLNY